MRYHVYNSVNSFGICNLPPLSNISATTTRQATGYLKRMGDEARKCDFPLSARIKMDWVPHNSHAKEKRRRAVALVRFA